MKRTALLFSGQGAQYVGMGKDLADHSSIALHLYEKADSILNMPLSETCFYGPEETLTGTDYCQPALFLQGITLLELLKEKLPRFHFEATAGLSLGEFTAHTAAGTFSFEDGLKLVAERGRLMQVACNATNGGMIALVGATSEQAEKIAAHADLDVANYNCPGQIVLSGDKDRIPAALEAATALGVKRAIPLNVAGAYHSRLMEPARQQLEPFLQKTTIHTSSVPVTSNVTGEFASGEANIRDVLLRQVTGSVRWESCVRTLAASGIERFIEIGPGRVLAGMCKKIDKNLICYSVGNLKELESIENDLK